MRVPLAAIVVSGVTACSLLSSLDGYSGGADAVVPGSSDASASSETGTPPSDVVDGATEAGGASRSATYRDAVIADAPLSYWRFDESAGPDAEDEMGRRPGAYVGPVVLGAPGLFGDRGAITIPTEGGAHVLVEGDELRFAGMVPFAAEAWVKPDTHKDFGWIGGTDVRTDAGRNGWGMLVNKDGVFQYEVWSSVPGNPLTLQRWSLGGRLAVGVYHHVVVSFTGSELTSFVDGTKIASSAPPAGAVPDVGVLRWGVAMIAGAPSGALEGSLDEVALYDHPLSEDRIQLHYALGRAD